jgi:hypothetical protein
MREQARERGDRLGARNGPRDRCGGLAVACGAGLRAHYEGLGVQVLDGGPTLNPSTYDLLAGIHAVAAEEVVVFPNSPNVVMAAERAAELSDREVRVVGSLSPQAGRAAAVAFDPGRDAAANAAALEEALALVRTGSVAPAAREDGRGRFRAGEAVGFVDDQVVAWGEPEATLRAVLGRLGEGAELVTCHQGAGAPLEPARVARLGPAGVELECTPGGQPGYWWLLSAE